MVYFSKSLIVCNALFVPTSEILCVVIPTVLATAATGNWTMKTCQGTFVILNTGTGGQKPATH